MVFSIKSCGKAHPFCSECRPEVGLHIGQILRAHEDLGATWRGRPNLKLLGNKHSLGYRHSPEAKAAIGSASLGNKHAVGQVRSLEVVEAARVRRVAWNKSPEGRKAAANGGPAISMALKGHVKSDSWRVSLSRSRKAHIASHSDDCRCLGHPGMIPSKLTGLEVKLSRLLTEYPDLITQKRFGRYRVDAYVPSLHLAFEADGARWHDPARDEIRDAWLMERYSLAVARLSERDLNEMKFPSTDPEGFPDGV